MSKRSSDVADCKAQGAQYRTLLARVQDQRAMMSLIFVSQAAIAPCNRSAELDDILAVATARNTMLDITGLLIASPRHFALLLEGPADSVAAVMADISVDPRHTGLQIVAAVPITTATCARWQMVRFGEANFGGAIVDPLLEAVHAGGDAQAIQRLKHLIDAITADSNPIDKSYLASVWDSK